MIDKFSILIVYFWVSLEMEHSFFGKNIASIAPSLPSRLQHVNTVNYYPFSVIHAGTKMPTFVMFLKNYSQRKTFNMKKPIKSIVTALLLMSVIPTQMYAGIPTPTEAATINIDEAKAEVMLKRLNEIKDMDKSNLTRPEKKALRKEVKEIEKVMAGNGGIYISVGALIIIILLLIIIF